MSRSLRYQNPDICYHLASQYVAGVMTKRVRRRTQALREKTPELDRAIAFFSDEFSILHERLPEAKLAKALENKIWRKIESEIALPNASPQTAHAKSKNHQNSWWYNVVVWRSLSGIGALASVMLAIILVFTTPQSPVQVGPSYLANMSAQDDPNQRIQFVISAYAKRDDSSSRLHVQWLKEHTGQTLHPLHLWTEDRETGKLIYIGLKPERGHFWDLSKQSWTAITNSRRLLITADTQEPSGENILFSGLCLQLKEWKS